MEDEKELQAVHLSPERVEKDEEMDEMVGMSLSAKKKSGRSKGKSDFKEKKKKGRKKKDDKNPEFKPPQKIKKIAKPAILNGSEKKESGRKGRKSSQEEKINK